MHRQPAICSPAIRASRGDGYGRWDRTNLPRAFPQMTKSATSFARTIAIPGQYDRISRAAIYLGQFNDIVVPFDDISIP